jgi:tetratricopeptide (TPR) repeat protein
LSRFSDSFSEGLYALEIARDIGDQRAEMNYLNNIGNILREQGQFEEALSFFKLARTLAYTLGDQRTEGYILGNIGAVYANIGDNAQSITFMQQHLQLAQKVEDQRGIAIASWNLGWCYESTGELTRAIPLIESFVAYMYFVNHPMVDMYCDELLNLRRRVEGNNTIEATDYINQIRQRFHESSSQET